LTGIWFGTLPGATIEGQAVVGRLTTEDGAVPLGPAGRWNGFSDLEQGSIQPAEGTGPDDFTIQVQGEGASELTLTQAWVPGQLPALVAG
ncbi:hypothetical protein, partial [Nocardioides sp.]|uniref:hypothetical protein n=1 Tax=Nocardioides sp. TaxID=35761 RepID=UPI0025F72E1F